KPTSPQAGARPAGTREALPDTLLRKKLPRFFARAEWRRAKFGGSAVSSFLPRGVATPRKELSPVREHLRGGNHVLLSNLRQLLKLAHAFGSLGAKQVTLAGMHAQDLAVGGDLETLLCAAVCLQFLLWLQ